MSNDQSIVQVLEEISEKYNETGLPSVELSAWVEKSATEDLRKSIGSQCSEIKPQKLITEKVNPRKLRTSIKRTRIPLNFCNSTYDNELLLSKNHVKKTEILNKPLKNKVVKENKLYSTDYQNAFKITTFSLGKSPKHKRNKSLITDKRKLDSYYEKCCLVVKKSPPTVSGFSVTFYSKNTQKYK